MKDLTFNMKIGNERIFIVILINVGIPLTIFNCDMENFFQPMMDYRPSISLYCETDFMIKMFQLKDWFNDMDKKIPSYY